MKPGIPSSNSMSSAYSPSYKQVARTTAAEGELCQTRGFLKKTLRPTIEIRTECGKEISSSPNRPCCTQHAPYTSCADGTRAGGGDCVFLLNQCRYVYLVQPSPQWWLEPEKTGLENRNTWELPPARTCPDPSAHPPGCSCSSVWILFTQRRLLQPKCLSMHLFRLFVLIRGTLFFAFWLALGHHAA